MRRVILFFFLFHILFAVHLYAQSKDDRVDAADSGAQHNFLGREDKPGGVADEESIDFTGALSHPAQRNIAYQAAGNQPAKGRRDEAGDDEIPFTLVNGVQVSLCLDAARKNDFDSTISACSQAIELDQGNWLAFRLKSFAYLKMGNLGQAKIDCEAAAKLGDKECQEWVRRVEREQEEEKTLKLLCRVVFNNGPPEDYPVRIDLASGTVNGRWSARITEDMVSWTVGASPTHNDAWFQLDRYTGVLLGRNTTKDQSVYHGKCVRVDEKQF